MKLTVTEAVELSGLSRSRIQQLANQKRIKASRFGRWFAIDSESLISYTKNRPPVGRPPKKVLTKV